jgi:hypothetical protein
MQKANSEFPKNNRILLRQHISIGHYVESTHKCVIRKIIARRFSQSHCSANADY